MHDNLQENRILKQPVPLQSRILCLVIIIFCWLIMVSAAGRGAWAEEPAQPFPELLQLSLEELGSVRITTVSKKGESLSGAAAAVHVITQEEIRRSGVNHIAETFRMVPGMTVGRANAHGWAVGARGFGHVYANKLLVLLDGRTIYTPLFAGVFWEETDTVLEDIDRIEVIRGPGATLWGANAVNGVINIITKRAQETQGLLMSGGGGAEERGFGTVRYGGKLAPAAAYRVYVKHSDRDEFTRADGHPANDDWRISQGGFRVDWEASELNQMTLQGDYYGAELGFRVRRPSQASTGSIFTEAREKVEGGNLLGRWTHAQGEGSELAVQAYYDRTDRHFGLGRELRDTVDWDLQHRFQAGGRHEIIWGLGYRYSEDDIRDSPEFELRDPSLGLHLGSAFVQDQIELVPERVRLTVGTKVEHNDFTGFEVQPSARAAWTPTERHTLWAAVSRAVRTPSRTERSVTLFLDPPSSVPRPALPAVIPLSGDERFRSEELIAYELGTRFTVHPRLTMDWAAFYNDYDRLRSLVAGRSELRFDSRNRPFLFLPFGLSNDLFGEGYGTELALTWQPRDWWRLRGSYSFLRLQLHTRGSRRSFSEGDEGLDPKHQVKLWSDLDLGRHVELGLGWRYVSDAPFTGVPAYTELDARLAWKPAPNCELAIVGRSLLAPHHREVAQYVVIDPNIEVDRMVYAKLTLRF